MGQKKVISYVEGEDKNHLFCEIQINFMPLYNSFFLCDRGPQNGKNAADCIARIKNYSRYLMLGVVILKMVKIVVNVSAVLFLRLKTDVVSSTKKKKEVK